DGELRERAMSIGSSGIAFNLNGDIRDHLKQHPIGKGFQSDGGLTIFQWNPRELRYADGGFIRNERIPGGHLGRGYLTVAPDLLFEVTSPNDIFAEVVRKVQEYRRAGVRLVWVLVPETRQAY